MRIMAGSKGFILVEVVIVSVIIAIFAAMAYPSYLRFIKDGQAEQAKAVINALATAERITCQNTGIFTIMRDGGNPKWVDITTTGVYGGVTLSGIYIVAASKIDTGDAPLFRFKVETPHPTQGGTRSTTFKITAEGRPAGGLQASDTVIYSYDATDTNSRDTWGGTLLACPDC